jgi:hypothetical protein
LKRTDPQYGDLAVLLREHLAGLLGAAVSA